MMPERLSDYSRNRDGFHDRLREYILSKHGSINAFCKAVGIRYPAQMTPYLKGKCFPGRKMMARLEKDGADMDWLIGGPVQLPRMRLEHSLLFSRYRMDIESQLRQVRLFMDRHASAYQPAIEAYALMDQQERIVELTGSIERFLAYQPQALIDASLRSILHPRDYADVSPVLHADRTDEDVLSFRSKFLTGSGGYLDVEWSVFARVLPMSDASEYAMVFRKAVG